MNIMRHVYLGGLAALAGLVFLNPTLSARVARPAPVPLRVARADCVFVGKVVSVADRTVTTKEGTFRVAVVKVEDGLLGTKGAKEIKVGFNPPQGRRPGANLVPGTVACFFLTRIPGQDLKVARMYGDVLTRDDGNFAMEVDKARRAVRLLEKSNEGLKSKKPEERFLTAGLLITRYRTPRGAGKTAPVDPAQSKLILEALAGADWTRYDPETGLNPLALFYQTGATARGFVRPADPKQFQAAAQKWLRDNAGTFRLERFIADEDPSK
jgi:hypothetical protein